MTTPREPLTLIVPPPLTGLRVDTALAALLRNHSAARLLRAVRAGRVQINELTAERTDRVRSGDVLRVRLVESPDQLIPSDPGPLRWLFRDAWCGVLAKPAGVLVHPTGPHQRETIANRVQSELDQQTRQRGLLRPGIVHRLDRETSGCLLLAFDHVAHRALQQQFENGRVDKSYLALVAGCMQTRTFVCDEPIGRHPGGGVKMATGPLALAARPARTEGRVVARLPSATLVRVHPETGRNHQIRVHLASLGHPLLGDELYGGTDIARETPDAIAAARQQRRLATQHRHALHAERLRVRHPISGAPLDVTCPVPTDFRELITSEQEAASVSPIDVDLQFPNELRRADGVHDPTEDGDGDGRVDRGRS